MKRERSTWDEFFMNIALDNAARSGCKYHHTGAVLRKNKRAVAMGYNGFFAGYKGDCCRETGICRKQAHGLDDQDKNSGKCWAMHAEDNTFAEVSREQISLQQGHETTLYTVLYPCSDCAKHIAHNGISEVVYLAKYREPNSQTEQIFRSRYPPVKLRRFTTPELLARWEEVKGEKD